MDEDDLSGWVSWHDASPRPEPNETEPPDRALALESDAQLATPFELGTLWEKLTAGQWQVRDTFNAGDRLYVVVEEPLYRKARRRRQRGLVMMERVLLGERAKVVAIDSAVTESTVAVAIKGQLRSMGLVCKVRATPLILVMAARAARWPRCRPVQARIALLPGDAATKRVISVRYPRLGAFDVLSGAERAVLSQLLEGKTYVEIAECRGASKRTIANQLGAAFRKLGVSGYGEMLDHVMTQALGARSAETRATA
jgi:DNA-binding CsgD family transcriptional regulator